MSNYSENKAAIDKFRKELKNMVKDIQQIDVRVLNQSVNAGSAYAKRNTPVDTGFMRKSWHASRTEKKRTGAQKELYNTADYASYLNYGHRIVNKSGETVGFIHGIFLIDKAVSYVNKRIVKEFKSEIERVNKRHDK